MARFGPETFDRLRRVLSPAPGGEPDLARRPAAVLVPLLWAGDEVRVVLTKRTTTVRTHRGHVSFPGGSRDDGDATLEGTALREAHEEVGLRPDDVEVLGVLADMPTAGSGYLIRPYVARVPHPYPFVRQPEEVERVITPPLAVFADPARRRTERWERDGVRYPVWFFDDVEGELVWGATARILVELCDRIAGREPERVEIPRPRADGDRR